MSKEVGKIFVERLLNNSDPLSNIVTVHLFCENAINSLIKAKAIGVEDFTKRNRDETYIPILDSNYSTKLYFVFSMGLIKQELYENLRLLNHWRNKAAHNIHEDIKKLPMDFHKYSENESKIKPQSTENEIVIGVAFATYVELHKFIEENYDIKL
ncbi:MAG: RND transporter [Solibacillus sp.]